MFIPDINSVAKEIRVLCRTKVKHRSSAQEWRRNETAVSVDPSEPHEVKEFPKIFYFY